VKLLVLPQKTLPPPGAAAEDTKIKLSLETQVEVREEFLTSVAGTPIHLQIVVTRRQFEDLIRTLLESTIELSRKALVDAKVEAGQIMALVPRNRKQPFHRVRTQS
jgi:molecular chaperone DnaK (HSP70)